MGKKQKAKPVRVVDNSQTIVYPPMRVEIVPQTTEYRVITVPGKTPRVAPVAPPDDPQAVKASKPGARTVEVVTSQSSAEEWRADVKRSHEQAKTRKEREKEAFEAREREAKEKRRLENERHSAFLLTPTQTNPKMTTLQPKSPRQEKQESESEVTQELNDLLARLEDQPDYLAALQKLRDLARSLCHEGADS